MILWVPRPSVVTCWSLKTSSNGLFNMAYPSKNWDSLIKKRTPHDIKWPSICQWFIGCSLERDLVSRCVWTTNAFYHSRACLNMAWRFITTQDGWQLSRVQKHCKLHVGKAELNTSCSYRWVQLTLLNHSQPLIHCILLLLVSNSVYTYVYIYNIYIPAKPLSRRRQNCHLSRSNFAPRAGETRFFLF